MPVHSTNYGGSSNSFGNTQFYDDGPGMGLGFAAFVPLIMLMGLGGFVVFIFKAQSRTRRHFSSVLGGVTDALNSAASGEFLQNLSKQKLVPDVSAALEDLVHHDPNFSRVLFLDFAYTLYSRLQEARGNGDLAKFQPYLGGRALHRLERLGRGTGRLTDVTGVVVGGARIESIRIRGRHALIDVAFETNYTEHRESTGGSDSIAFTGPETAFYCEETWTFQRSLDVLSPTPSSIGRIGCPSCGAPLEATENQACAHCNEVTLPGAHHWSVVGIKGHHRDTVPPTLTTSAPERGTDFPTIIDPHYDVDREQLLASSPDFSWHHAQDRFVHIFRELQQAWTSLEWERSRPFETDQLFQTHLFWIEEYKRQQLRNVLEDVQVEDIQPVKIRQDAFYDAITVRVFASMKDSTVDADGKLICGDPTRSRQFSEYWTFVRRRGIAECDKANDSCPNCGAPLRINMSGVCEFCNGNVGSGEFDWVLSRIEQDDVYAG